MADAADPVPSQAAWNRFLLVSLAFLAYESAFIALLDSNIVADTDSSILFLGIVILAGVGYLVYGALVRTWLSVVVIALPILIALTIASTGSGSIPAAEGVPLYVAWTVFSFFFFPVWLAGLFISFAINQPDEGGP